MGNSDTHWAHPDEKGNKKAPTRVVIMGAAGRDFHNFNMVFRDNPQFEVVAFTATQIPKIAGRCYPASLAGRLYPNGITIVEETQLTKLCHQYGVDHVVFAYSDVPHSTVMHKASLVLATGADFIFLGPARTMLDAAVPVIATSAVRTGCGKSQTTRWLSHLLKQHGLKVAVIRHPMPYGDLENQAVQRFANTMDLDSAGCTVEEREEYEPHLRIGNVVYAGVDYARITKQAAAECDVILWDGGNNDFPFIRPDLHLVLVDPLRAGNETSHHPGETVLRMADIVVIAKSNSASDADIHMVSENVRSINPGATLVRATSPVHIEQNDALQGKRVLVVEDGPSITHGGMPYGAGYVAAIRYQAKAIVDPRPTVTNTIAAVYEQYPHIGPVLPAVGYHAKQLQALEQSINAADVDVVVAATPCDLGALISVNKPLVRVYYDFAEIGEPKLSSLVEGFLRQRQLI